MKTYLKAAAAFCVILAWVYGGGVCAESPKLAERSSILLQADRKNANPQEVQRIMLPAPAPSVITLAGVVKGIGIQSADEDDKGVAFLAVRFLDAQGNELGYKKMNEWFGDFDWRPWAYLARVPRESTQFEIIWGMDGASGKALFDQVEVHTNFPDDQEPENLLVDGGFEYAGPLSEWELADSHRVIFPGHEGRGALRISHSEFDSSSASQTWVLPAPAPEKTTLQFSTVLKMEGVTTSQGPGGVLVTVDFFDSSGQSLGNATLWGPGSGASDWQKIEKEIDLPAGTAKGTIRLEMKNAKGAASFDHVRLAANSGNGILRRPLESKTDASHWKTFIPSKTLTGALDGSGLLDPPAGKHGFLQVKGNQFVFGDGTPVRFFGVNIQAEHAFPAREEAEAIAERLAQLGFNLVRLHHLDAPWAERNLFEPSRQDTQHFSKENLERLDYFISRLKAQGIYVYLDLLVSRKFRKKDKVPAYLRLAEGAKMAAEFDPRLMVLQKRFARDLLTHRNRYTQLRTVDEPAVALLDLINESSLFKFPSEGKTLPQIYQEELENLKADYFKEKGIQSDEEEFYADLQTRYFKEMSEFLRALGLKIPMAGSNLPLGDKDLMTNAALDFIDHHSYWDHPRGGFGDLVKFHNRSPVEAGPDEDRLLRFSRQRVPEKPFVVGEWSVPWPNEFRAAGPLLAASQANSENWNGLLLFNYNGHLEPTQIEGNFDISTQPEIFLTLPSVSRFFRESAVPSGNGMQWDRERGLVLIETEKTFAAIGKMKGRELKAGAVRLKIRDDFAFLMLISLDDLALKESRHLLLTAVARSENQGTVYNATRTLLRNPGTSPILMEPVEGTVLIPLEKRPPAQIFSLDAGGKRRQSLSLKNDGNNVEIPVGQAPLYEIIFGKES